MDLVVRQSGLKVFDGGFLLLTMSFYRRCRFERQME